MRNKKLVLLTFAATCLVAMTACAKNPGKKGYYTYNTYNSVMPSNWNELTYQDNNDTDILGYISGSFFNYDFEFDAAGKPVPGKFRTTYDGATNLVDVTADFAGSANYAVPEGADKGYAYKITLRDDLKWEDGTPIRAEDFVYTMKEQLNPLFKNYRADSFYNSSTIIHNAHDYVFQGEMGWFDSRTVFGGVYDEANDDKLLFDFTDNRAGDCYYITWLKQNYGSYLSSGAYTVYTISEALGVCAADDLRALDGKTLAQIKADATAKAAWERVIGAWQTDPGEELDFFITEFTYPAMDFNKVGIFTGNDTNSLDLYIVLDKPVVFLEYGEDGNVLKNSDGTSQLNYQAAYYLSSLPLVKKDLYEANKHAPSTTDLWTTTYNQSVESTASWGPYKLTYFQAAKQYVLEKNENWYGYGMSKYAGQYQADRIVCDLMPDYKTAWLAFQKGDIASIGVDVSIAADYKKSSRAVYTGDDYINSMQLQSSAEALKKRESTGVDREMLLYPEFRKALSLAIDRADYVAACTTACLPGFGIFNEFHYYDVAHGGVYRHTEQAKKVICETYGVEYGPGKAYATLDEAYEAVTGYNLELARKLVDEAVDKAIAAGTYKAGDAVMLDFGTSVKNEATTRHYEYFSKAFENLFKGTKLEGKFELEFSEHGDKWANDFRDGAYDICLGGWSGAAWNPGYFLLAYLSPDYMYSTAWDTYSVTATYDPDGEGTEYEELTMTLMEWYNCLNGITSDTNAPALHNWAEGVVPTEFRLGIIAMLEGVILKNYYTVPLYNSYGATLVSYKVDYITTEYNTFMGYGGIRYMTFNYDDYEWNNVKASFKDKYKA